MFNIGALIVTYSILGVPYNGPPNPVLILMAPVLGWGCGFRARVPSISQYSLNAPTSPQSMARF